MQIGLVYFSESGVTKKLVLAAAAEIEAQGVNTFIYEVLGNSIEQGRFTDKDVFSSLNDCQAIVFASPTYMGSASAQFKAFADATSDFWMSQPWAGKIAAGITSGSSMNGDQSSTLAYFTTLASQHGMLWLGLDVAHGMDSEATTENSESRQLDRLGCSTGVTAYSRDGEVDKTDLATARYLGRRVAIMIKRFKHGNLTSST